MPSFPSPGFVPFGLDQSDTGDHSAILGMPFIHCGQTLVVCQVASGGLASGSNGTALTARTTTLKTGCFTVNITGSSASAWVVGWVPAGLTKAVTSGEYILAVRDGYHSGVLYYESGTASVTGLTPLYFDGSGKLNSFSAGWAIASSSDVISAARLACALTVTSGGQSANTSGRVQCMVSAPFRGTMG